jgi:hypothetical protein
MLALQEECQKPKADDEAPAEDRALGLDRRQGL